MQLKLCGKEDIMLNEERKERTFEIIAPKMTTTFFNACCEEMRKLKGSFDTRLVPGEREDGSREEFVGSVQIFSDKKAAMIRARRW